MNSLKSIVCKQRFQFYASAYSTGTSRVGKATNLYIKALRPYQCPARACVPVTAAIVLEI